MQNTKWISTALAAASLATLTTVGCTLQEAKDTPSPAVDNTTATVPSAQASPNGGSPDGGGTTVSAAAPVGGGATPASGAAAHEPATLPGAPMAVNGGVRMPGAASGMPPMMGMGNPTAPLTPTPALDKKIADAEKKGDKKAIGAAYAERGTARMTDDNSGPRVKYRAALDDYRKALKADPTNADAAKNKKQIEDIYTQMGRPIPGA